jgi:DNA-binding SARP family transcriptional activator
MADGKVMPLGRRQERLLLALLALSANQLIPADRLIDEARLRQRLDDARAALGDR